MSLGKRLNSQSSSRRMALAVAVLFALTSGMTLARPTRSLAWDGNSFDSSSEAELIALTNRARVSAGLHALKVDSTLTSVARWRSKDMIDRDYFSHDIPGAGRVFDKLSEIGYCYKVAGENIGWTTYPDDQATAAIQQMFMDSAGHRANILGSDWEVIGVGAYKGSGDKKMWTVLFADKCGTTPTATPDPTPSPTPDDDPQADAQGDPETLPEANPDANCESGADSPTDTNPGARTKANSRTDADADPGTVPRTDPCADPRA